MAGIDWDSEDLDLDPEPSAVDRLAAIEDSSGDSAKAVKRWETQMARKQILNNVAKSLRRDWDRQRS